MILPTGASSFKEAMKMGVEVYHNLKVIALATSWTVSSSCICISILLMLNSLFYFAVCHQEEVWTRCY